MPPKIAPHSRTRRSPEPYPARASGTAPAASNAAPLTDPIGASQHPHEPMAVWSEADVQARRVFRLRRGFSDTLRAAGHSICLVLAGCPQLLDDDFNTVPPEATGGTPGGSGGQGSGPAQAGAADRGGAGGDATDTGGAGGATDTGGSGNAGSCTVGATRGPNGHCYVIGTTSSSWSEARSNCLSFGIGWDLATVLDSQDSAFLSRTLTTEAWVGADDTNGAGVWRWVRDGAEFWQGGSSGSALNDAYVNWSSNEPTDGSTADCLRISPSALWAAVDCGSGFPAVCEGPAE